MEQTTRLQNSRNTYKGHVTRQFTKVEELMTSETIDELILFFIENLPRATKEEKRPFTSWMYR